jgi:hypothetical protein
VLARLDRIDGVERSYVNRTGTLLRLSVAPSADPERVAFEALKVLGEGNRNPARLASQALDQALEQEEWRAADRVNELSAIEFRTLAVRRVLWLAVVLAAVGAVIFLYQRWRRVRQAARKES